MDFHKLVGCCVDHRHGPSAVCRVKHRRRPRRDGRRRRGKPQHQRFYCRLPSLGRRRGAVEVNDVDPAICRRRHRVCPGRRHAVGSILPSCGHRCARCGIDHRDAVLSVVLHVDRRAVGRYDAFFGAAPIGMPPLLKVFVKMSMVRREGAGGGIDNIGSFRTELKVSATGLAPDRGSGLRRPPGVWH